MTGPSVVGIAGWKNSGKTTLTELLVAELKARGYRVSTVKRAHHEADVDREGTDSFRHRQAGAGEVLLVTPRRWALMHEMSEGEEPPLEELIARLSPCDIVLVEGYKTGSHPKIEVRRSGAGSREPFPPSANVIAIAADHEVDGATVPVFALDAVASIADLIVSRTGPQH